MHWTWDPEKDRQNIIKHDISFSTAQLVFQDSLFTSREDPYPHEQRWQTTGTVGPSVIIVVHTWPAFDEETGEAIGRIISARKATSYERMAYEEGLE